jgi:hypothetical protein
MLVVTVPNHVGWQEVGGRIRVSYEVVLTDQLKRRVGGTSGTCWEDRLRDCAALVREYAEGVLRRIP